MNHLVNHIKNPERYRLAREWFDRLEATPNVRAYLVEAAFGDRQHEVTTTGHESQLQVRTKSEIWVKENLINLAVRHLVPREAQYIAWVDADTEFRDPSWAQETLHQLQHTEVLQPWQSCVDLGHLGGVIATHKSFGFLHQAGIRKQRRTGEPYQYAHTGFAWACTRAFWERVGGLVDFAILGSADHHMAWAMVGEVDSTIHQGMAPSFFRRLREWQSRAVPACDRQVGFAPGRIEHHFHGPKARRFYRERWQILVDHHFDPDTDLMHDAAGVVQLVGKPDLEHAIRKYNRSRFEDSIEDA